MTLVKPEGGPWPLRSWSPVFEAVLLPLPANGTDHGSNGDSEDPSLGVGEEQERQGFCPVLLGASGREQDERNRWKVLLQLAVCARMNGLVATGSDPYMVQAFYLNEEYKAERYLAYADYSVSMTFTYSCR